MLFAVVDWSTLFFGLFALITCVFALGVLFSSNIVHMAFYLVLSLGASSGLFFLAGAEFVGAMQLMIYVGGTLVLLIFGVMLTAQSRFISMRTRAGEWVMAVIVGGSLLFLLLTAAFNVDSWREPNRNLVKNHELRDLAGRLEQASADLADVASPLDEVREQLVDQSEETPGEDSLPADLVKLLSREAAAASTGLQAVQQQHGKVILGFEDRVAASRTVAETLKESIDESSPSLQKVTDLNRALQDSVARLQSELQDELEKTEGLAKALEIPIQDSKQTTQIGLAFTGVRVDRLTEESDTLRDGMSGYLLPFVIVSVHLLVVLIGAAYMARTKRRKTETNVA